MSRLLHLGPELRLPALEAQTQTIVVYGGKGMGKTNLAKVLAEELARENLRFSWLDPVGVAWGLKHSADGKRPGVEVLILGGTHSELPIEPGAGEVVADLVVDEEVSVIIDISRDSSGRMWKNHQKIAFTTDYCNRLFERQGERRRPIMQMIDEAGRFVPQMIPKGAEYIALCKGAIEQMVELGRNVGVGVALITQRSARMDKSVSELAEMMVAFRTVGPHSIDAIVDWFGDHVEKVKQREFIEKLRRLPKGTALVVSPGWLDIEGEYAIRAGQTFDSSETPVAGQERTPTGKGAEVDLDKYRSAMVETIEKAEATDPRKLQTKVRDQQKALEERGREVADLRALLEETRARPAEPVIETVTETVVREVPVLPPGAIGDLGQLVFAAERMATDLRVAIESAPAESTGLPEQVVDRTAERTVPRTQARTETAPKSLPPRPEPVPQRTPERTDELSVMPSSDLEGVKFGRAEKAIITILLTRGNRSKKQLAVQAGYAIKGGGFNNALGKLRTLGIINKAGDPIVLLAVPEGFEPEPMPSGGRELLDYWLVNGSLGKAEKLILNELWERKLGGKTPAPKAEVAAATGYEPGGGGFNNALGRLRTLELVTRRGELDLTEEFGG